PAVELAALSHGWRGRIRSPLLGRGIEHEEAVTVPEFEQASLRFVGRLPAEVDISGRILEAEDPAHDVGARPLGGVVEVDGVAEALVHRPAIFAAHGAVA